MSPGTSLRIAGIILCGLSMSLIPLAVPASAAPRSSGPVCGPASLGSSALLDGAVTVSPLPGSRDATPQTQVSFVGVPASSLSVSSVVGSISGAHSGRLEPYSQGDGASFVPSRPFAEGERVTVRGTLRAGGASRPLLDVFAIADEDRISTTPETIHPGRISEQQSFVSRPDLHPPVVAVTATSPASAPGDVFVAPYTGPGQAGPMILEPDGSVAWFQPLPEHVYAANFRVQEYAGRPVLTWWQGDISIHGFGLGNDVILDSTYRRIATVKAGNGLQADLHDFQLTPSGTALITAFDPVLCDLAGVGGPAYGAVTDGVVQEVDVRTGLVRMQWTSLDHVGLSQSYERAASSIGFPFDYFHVNSIDLDADGTLLISSRNTWTVYDVNRSTGQVQWRLGGRNSSFQDPAAARTAWQHDARMIPGGGISMFDNGSSPTVHAQSRAIVLGVDPRTRAVTLVSQFTHPAPLVAESQGDMQALPDGNWFVGWGQEPDFSEFSGGGALLFDAHMPAHDQSYRAFRFQWTGTPVHGPAVGFQGGSAYASWNGDTRVASWHLLAGSSPATLATVAVAPKTGFETAIPLPAGAGGPDIEVQAFGAQGELLATSATVPTG
jgi:outer membrane protein assembly factor BamB